MSKYFIVASAGLLLLISCTTPQFDAEKQSCSAYWAQKIPAQFDQRLVTRLQSYQVPNGQMSCTYFGYTQNCTQGMTTQYVPYTAVETVDLMAPVRNSNIEGCAANACMKKYGNAECKV